MSGGTSDVCFAQHGQTSHLNGGTSDVCFAQQGQTSHCDRIINFTLRWYILCVFAQQENTSHFNGSTSDVCFAQHGHTSHFNGSNVRYSQGVTLNPFHIPKRS